MPPQTQQDEQTTLLWRSGDIEFDFLRTELNVAGQVIALETHSVSVLICLIQAEGKLVHRAQLLAAAWPGREVPELLLDEAINEINAAFGENAATLLQINAEGVLLKPPTQTRIDQIKSDAEANTTAKQPVQSGFARQQIIRSTIVLLGVIFVVVLSLSFIRPLRLNGLNKQDDGPVLAILPLRNASLQQEDNYLGEGIAEELINQLSSVEGIHIIARTSSFIFKDDSVSAQAIAKQLNADYVLSGSLLQSQDNIDIELHLTRAIDGVEQWSYQSHDSIKQLLSSQSKMAVALASELKISDFMMAQEAHDPLAFDLYLQARKQVRLGTQNAYSKANELYQRAITIDPNYVPALVGLAANYRRQAEIAQLPVEQGYLLAQQTIAKALAVAPNSASALAEAAWVEFNYHNDIDRAAQYLSQALQANPRAFSILANAAVMLHDLDHGFDALRVTQHIARYDPLNSRAHANLGLNYLSLGRLDDAISSFQTAIRLSPKRVITHYNLAVAHLLKGQVELAAEAIKRESSDNFRLIGECLVLHSLGQKQAAEQKLQALIADYEKDSAFNIAYVYAWRGESEQAFEWLQKAVIYRDPGLTEILVEPTLYKLQSDPRWNAFLRQIKRDPASLKQIQFDRLIPATL